jgi:HTH-like domain
MISAEKASGVPVSLLCELFEVSRSGYYEWATRAPSDRDLQDAWLTEKIREIHAENRGVYGAPRIHAELRMGHGTRVGRKRVERLMAAAGISGLVVRKRGRTTVSREAIGDTARAVMRASDPTVPLWNGTSGVGPRRARCRFDRQCDHPRRSDLARALGTTQPQHSSTGVEPDERFRAAGARAARSLRRASERPGRADRAHAPAQYRARRRPPDSRRASGPGGGRCIGSREPCFRRPMKVKGRGKTISGSNRSRSGRAGA